MRTVVAGIDMVDGDAAGGQPLGRLEMGLLVDDTNLAWYLGFLALSLG